MPLNQRKRFSDWKDGEGVAEAALYARIERGYR